MSDGRYIRDEERRYVVGIDPGLTGAIAYFKETPHGLLLLGVRDMPTTAALSGKGQMLDLHELTALLRPMMAADSCVCYIEQVAAMTRPGEKPQGVSSMFKFGQVAMAPEAIAVALGLQVKKITPSVWKKDAELTKRGKDAVLPAVKGMYPDLAPFFSRKKDVGRADAVLIGYYGHRRYGENNEGKS